MSTEATSAATKTYEDGLRDAAKLCQDAADRLLAGAGRLNETDRRSAAILSGMANRILGLLKQG